MPCCFAPGHPAVRRRLRRPTDVAGLDRCCVLVEDRGDPVRPVEAVGAHAAHPYPAKHGPQDLVLIFCDGITRSWKQIIYFSPVEKATPVPPEALVAASGFDVPDGYRILSDERGVRIVPN